MEDLFDFGREKKKKVLRFDLKDSREGFCPRGRGRSFRAEGPKTKKGAATISGKSGTRIWKLTVSEAEWRVREGV